MIKKDRHFAQGCLKGITVLCLITVLAACSSSSNDDGPTDPPTSVEGTSDDDPGSGSVDGSSGGSNDGTGADSGDGSGGGSSGGSDVDIGDGSGDGSNDGSDQGSEEPTTPVSPPESSGEVDTSNARALTIDVLKMLDATIFFSSVVPLELALEVNPIANCVGGGSYSSDVDTTEILTEFDDCRLLSGENAILNGEILRPISVVPGVAQGAFEFDDLTAGFGNRTVEVNGDTAGMVSEASSQLSPEEFRINDNGSRSTVSDGGYSLVLTESGAIQNFGMGFTAEFDRFPGRAFSLSATSVTGDSVTCPTGGTILIIDDDSDSEVLRIDGGSGNNFTYTIGTATETISCNEVPTLLSN